MEAIGPGPYQRALEKRGTGLHHVALVADDMDATVERGVAAGWRLVKPGKVRWLGCGGLPLVEPVPKGTTASPLVTAVTHALPAGAKGKLAALGLEAFVTKAAKSGAGLVLEGRSVSIADLA